MSASFDRAMSELGRALRDAMNVEAVHYRAILNGELTADVAKRFAEAQAALRVSTLSVLISWGMDKGHGAEVVRWTHGAAPAVPFVTPEEGAL